MKEGVNKSYALPQPQLNTEIPAQVRAGMTVSEERRSRSEFV